MSCAVAAVFGLVSFSAAAAVNFRAASSASVVTQVGVTPSHVSSGGIAESGNVTSITINRPGAASVGRVLVAQITLKGVVAGITAPAGWNLIDQSSTSSAGDEITQAAYWRVQDAVEPVSYTWTWAGGRRAVGGMLAFDNVEPVNPVDVWGVRTTNNSTTITLPTLTTTSDSTMLVALLGSSYATNHSTPGGMTERYDQNTSGSQNGVTSSAATQSQANSGSTGAKTATGGNAADNVAHLIALRPAGALTIAVPTGTTAGDVMIASVVYRPCSASSGGACTTTITPPAGWTLIRNVNTTTGGGTDGYGSRLFVYWRVATAAEPVSYTWYFGGALLQAGAAGSILSFSGVDIANPIVAEAGQVTPVGSDNTRQHRAPSIDTGTVTNTMLVSSHTVNSSGSWTPPAGMTERVDIASRPLTNDLGVSLEVNTEARAASGVTGTRLATLSNPPAGDQGGTHMLALRPAVVGLNHVRLEHDGAAVTCAAEPITLRACADSNCTSLYSAGSTTVTLAGSGWASNPVTFTGSTTVNLSITSPQTVTLATTAVSPAPASGYVCFDGATANNTTACQLPFADTGFIFSAIPAQTAGVTSGNVTLQAVRRADNSATCVGVFTGNVAIDMASQCVDPDTCAGRQVTINATAIANNPAAAIGSYTPVTLNFGANSTATFTLNYPDVGRMNLNARYALGGSDYMLGASNAFVVRPDHFTLAGIVQDAAPNKANPGAADATGDFFVSAGENFRVTVTARTQSGLNAPNYGREITPEGVRLTANLVAPAGGNNPPLTNATAFGAFSNGSATGTTFGWGEVGIITLTPSVGDSDYLGAGDVTGTTSGNVGRFRPAHFALDSGTPPVLSNRAALLPCASSFSYMGEPMRLIFRLLAQNTANATTQNYTGAYAKLNPATPGSAFGLGARSGTTDLTARTAASYPVATPAWANGVLDVPVANPLYVTINRAATPDGPYTGTQLGIAPADTDGVLMNAYDLDVDNNATNDHTAIATTTEIRYGRLHLANAFGSELLPLPMPMRAQYYNGPSAGFVTNGADNCTSLALSAIQLTSAVESVTADNPIRVKGVLTTTASVGTPFTSGDAGLIFSAPTAGGDGYVDVTPTTPSYLQFDWDGDGVYDNNPTARANFGVYRGSPRQIYLRERF